jgi:homoserine acetyltransferase
MFGRYTIRFRHEPEKGEFAMSLDYETYTLGDVKLQRGATLRDCKLAYKTFGTLSPRKDNVIVFPTIAFDHANQLSALDQASFMAFTQI